MVEKSANGRKICQWSKILPNDEEEGEEEEEEEEALADFSIWQNFPTETNLAEFSYRS